MNLNEWSSLAQIIIAIITLVGVLTSLYMSIKALREVQLDRRVRQAPHLAFKSGGFQIPIEFVKAGKRVPGLAPEFVESIFSELPDDAESVRVKHEEEKDGAIDLSLFGRLTNHGMGPAFETSIKWVPKQIRVGSELFDIDSKKRSEPRYNINLNETYPLIRNINPGEQTELCWLPLFIEKDVEKKITEASGILEISCQDVFKTEHRWKQGFYIATGYSEAPPYVHVTFGGFDEYREL
jgi:hypothetical protein